MEGIVRHARLLQPELDIVMLHFVDPEKIADLRAGKTPEVIASHERVAAHYGVPSIDLAREITERIDAAEFTWESDFKNLHPSPFGMSVYARSIERLFDAAWKQPPMIEGAVQAHTLPAAIDEKSYFRGRLVDVDGGKRLADRRRLDAARQGRHASGVRPRADADRRNARRGMPVCV